MSITQKPPLHTTLKQEWDHLKEMPVSRLLLLVLPSVLLFPINPLLPPAAYALQRWAGASWAWRDRWTSVWSWARQGSWLVIGIAGITLLGRLHAWIFPEMIIVLQTFWHAHLPGVLSLSPLDRYALIARTLLLLPLTPVLALFYEQIDSRTPIRLTRVLTPIDLVEPAPKTETPDHKPTEPPTVNQAPPQEPPRKPKKKRQEPSQPAAQMTIDSFLGPQPAPDSRPTEASKPTTRLAKKKTPTGTPLPIPPKPPVTEDWDDMAE